MEINRNSKKGNYQLNAGAYVMHEGGSISLRDTQKVLDAPQCKCRWTIQGLGCLASRPSEFTAAMEKAGIKNLKAQTKSKIV